jgi:hypothetical protein
VSQTETGHPSDALLLATIDPESVGELATIRAHASECPRCAARQRALAEDDARISALLVALDDPAPPANQPRFLRRSSRRWLHRGLRIAGAAATLAVAAAAIMVSPVHRWVLPHVDIAPPPQHPGAPKPPTPAAVASGIAVPVTRSLAIVFRHEQALGIVAIDRTADGEITFRSRGGNTAYQVAAGQVSIDNLVPADEYQITIPRSVQQVRITVGTRVLLRWPEDSAQRVTSTQSGPLHIPLAAGATHAP